MATQTVSRLNPYRDPGPWGTVTIGGVKIPGVILSISGHVKIEEWAVQKGISVSNAVTVWRGTQLAEGIKIVTNLHDEESFDAWTDVRDVLAPKLGSKPPSLQVVNAAINWAGISRVSRKYVMPADPAPGLSWTGELLVIEFRQPKQVKVGPADPPKAKTENDILADQLADVVNAAKKL